MTKKKEETTQSKKSAAATRKNIRFQAEPNTVALIDFNDDIKSPFEPSIAALVLEESYRGCGAVASMSDKLKIGAQFRVKLGEGPILRAEIRWRTELDAQVIRLGIMYLE